MEIEFQNAAALHGCQTIIDFNTPVRCIATESTVCEKFRLFRLENPQCGSNAMPIVYGNRAQCFYHSLNS